MEGDIVNDTCMTDYGSRQTKGRKEIPYGLSLCTREFSDPVQMSNEVSATNGSSASGFDSAWSIERSHQHDQEFEFKI